jgi:hypothetical protein
MKARQMEASRIKAANRAVAVVRLMDGRLRDWAEFLQPDVDQLESLPRRSLKAGHYDVKRRVSKDIRRFCQSNFSEMTEEILAKLYDDVKAARGLEMPLLDFQAKYAHIRPTSLKGNPLHSTVHISLWGLQFEFPEKYLADDVALALKMALYDDKELNTWRRKHHSDLVSGRSSIAGLFRNLKFHSRMALLSCFNLALTLSKHTSTAWHGNSYNNQILSIIYQRTK